MADLLALDLVDKRLVTDQIVLTVGYDKVNLSDPKMRRHCQSPVSTDHYGRSVPKHAHGSKNLPRATSSAKLLMREVCALYDDIINKQLLIRRLYLTAARVVSETMSADKSASFEQLELFTDYDALEKQETENQKALEREKKMQQAVLHIKKKFGNNAVLRGIDLEDAATATTRNQLIGGHKA